MIIRRTTATINTVLTGIVALLISSFLASGAIGENYTDKTFIAPEFFLILGIWGIGALLTIWLFVKDSIYIFTVSLIITWLSIPVGFRLAADLARMFA